MRRLLLLGVALAVLAGCDKLKKKKDAAPAPASEGPGVHAPTGVVVNPGLGGGGGGGAVQAVRKAVGRTVSQNDLHNLHLFINTAAGAQMPSREEILAAIRTDAPQLHRQIQAGDIVLTGIRSREGVWAWTREPQTVAGQHLVVTNSGVEPMPAQALKQRLEQQRGR